VLEVPHLDPLASPSRTYTGCTIFGLNLYSEGLSIGELARRTGIAATTVRAWERRYGFPRPQRLPKGHRRYSEADVVALAEVLRARDAGIRLEVAVAQVLRTAAPTTSSLFSVLRASLPGVEPVVLHRRSMSAVSHAIEDEAAVRGVGGVVIGSFQHARFWRATVPRWRAIAARADATVAIAVLPRSRARDRMWEVGIAATAPIAREWAVICDSQAFAGCLVGVERPADPDRPAPRTFEALWTVEPGAVRSTARAASRIVGPPPTADLSRALGRLEEPAVAGYDSLRSATALTNRVLTYLDPAV
jgi:DICT domain-containing protein